jgi:uncharacterized protein (TIGR00730 family)
MAEIKSLCLYCGSSTGHNAAYREAATELGTKIAERGVRLIYGGGQIGLMGIAADAALAAGGAVIGVIPKFLMDAEVGHRGATELVVVANMHERKQRMFDLADGFVVLPGGLGTLDEMMETITWKQLGLHDKPVALLDVEGYWGALIEVIDRAIAEGFARREVKNLFLVARTADEVFAALAAAPEAAIRPEPSRL